MNRVAQKIFNLLLDSGKHAELRARFPQTPAAADPGDHSPTPNSLVLDIGSHGAFSGITGRIPTRSSGWMCLAPGAGRPARPRGHCRCAGAPFRDHSVAILCNSVLEHLGSLEEQRKAAVEIARVGRATLSKSLTGFFP